MIVQARGISPQLPNFNNLIEKSFSSTTMKVIAIAALIFSACLGVILYLSSQTNKSGSTSSSSRDFKDITYPKIKTQDRRNNISTGDQIIFIKKSGSNVKRSRELSSFSPQHVTPTLPKQSSYAEIAKKNLQKQKSPHLKTNLPDYGPQYTYRKRHIVGDS